MLAHVSPTVLDPQSWEEEGKIEQPVLETAVQPIRRIRMFINVESLEDKPGEAESRDPTMFSVRMQCELAFAEGHLYKVMSSASDLRVLKLGLPRWPAYDEQEAVYYYDDDQAPERFSRLEFVPQDIDVPQTVRAQPELLRSGSRIPHRSVLASQIHFMPPLPAGHLVV